MRNEIVDEIVRAERIAGTLLLTANQNAKTSVQKTKATILDSQKNATISNKKLYNDLLLSQENDAKIEYDQALSSCQDECEIFKQNCKKNVAKVAKLLANEVKK